MSLAELARENQSAIDKALAAFSKEQHSALTEMSSQFKDSVDKQKLFNVNIGKEVVALTDSVGAAEDRILAQEQAVKDLDTFTSSLAESVTSSAQKLNKMATTLDEDRNTTMGLIQSRFDAVLSHVSERNASIRALVTAQSEEVSGNISGLVNSAVTSGLQTVKDNYAGLSDSYAELEKRLAVQESATPITK